MQVAALSKSRNRWRHKFSILMDCWWRKFHLFFVKWLSRHLQWLTSCYIKELIKPKWVDGGVELRLSDDRTEDVGKWRKSMIQTWRVLVLSNRRLKNTYILVNVLGLGFTFFSSTQNVLDESAMILCKVENNKVDCVYEVIRVYYRGGKGWRKRREFAFCSCCSFEG